MVVVVGELQKAYTLHRQAEEEKKKGGPGHVRTEREVISTMKRVLQNAQHDKFSTCTTQV